VNGVIRMSFDYGYDEFGMATPPKFLDFLPRD
jgi:hypothetical protein